MNSPLFYRYYDSLYTATKDYRSETGAILEKYRDITGRAPLTVLDVGCGTGNHAFCFAGNRCKTTGIDIDNGMIAAAKKKIRHPEVDPLFLACDISELPSSGFELAVSLFNVVSYILNAGELLGFFAGIHKRLAPEGVLIFDCWNGLAAILNPPKEQVKKVRLGKGASAEITNIPSQGPSGETVLMHNKVAITDPTGETSAFTYDYTQRLWTPETLKDLLHLSGFQVLSLADAGDLGMPASPRTWKIAFLCLKKDLK